MAFLDEILLKSNDFKIILNEIFEAKNTISISNLADIHKAHFAHSITKIKKIPALLIVPNENVAQKMVSDLNFMGSKANFYPSRDFNFYNINGQSKEFEHQRIAVLSQIFHNELDIVVSTIDAIMQFTMPKMTFQSCKFKLTSGMNISPKEINQKLIKSGYERYEQVDGVGQFSLRGGILDIFSTNSNNPIRVEFWGDTIDSISYFDISTQRRTETIQSIEIVPVREVILNSPEKLLAKIQQLKDKLSLKMPHSKAVEILNTEIDQLKNTGNIGSRDKFISLIYENPNTLLDYLPKNTITFICEQAQVNDRLKTQQEKWVDDFTLYLEDGILCKELSSYQLDKNAILSFLLNKQAVYLDLFLTQSYFSKIDKNISFNAHQVPSWNGSISLLKEDLNSFNKKQTIVILAGTQKATERIVFDLSDIFNNVQLVNNLNNIQTGIKNIVPGSLSSGFEYPEINFSLITHNQIEKSKKNIQKKKNKSKNIYSISDLNIGDYVVHSMHGIGIFNGVHKLEIQNVKKDYIKISYAKGDTLYVPVTQLDLVDKYIGPGAESRVKLNKLGSNDWQNSKSKAKKATQNIAKELIKLYSARIQTKGHAFSEDNELQRDFETQFEYEETPDQMRCIDEIKADMEKSVPMDRLLCGDVGFGKTEVALRAAFKCVCDSKQCAILVPTTILAWQHFQTILKRFEAFPIRIELLSRFRTPKQQETILKRLKRGEIDIIIGTHRLVQNDVSFHDLGLVIIDEEQRFGVKQKEKFKEIAKNVDILTLSATPIPRTLNMAMSGLRDMSSLEEAPQNRVPVQTYVLEHNQTIINDAIRRELRRGGQIYYMLNNVGKISQKAISLQLQIPEAKVGYALGKMSEQELSKVWQKVIEHELDILVCTTIIETGIDIANVNTLIIENADHLGLSQLHQIRGRVGRSERRAFAYLTYNRSKVLSEISQKRLSAIKEFTEFGSGFKIAMRDLELRGAGNILGGEQHGHLADVGYDMYIKLLSNAINEEKGQPAETLDVECLVDIQVNAYIPEKYISNVNQRLDIYRRISDIRSKTDSIDVIDELIDRFGDPPESVTNLVDIALIRNTAASLGIYEIRQQNDNFLLFSNNLNESILEKFIKSMSKRITIKSTNKPHICIAIDSSLSVISNLKDILGIS